MASQDVIPAGRSWMEKIGSHGIVLVVLVIVVAAAILSNRGPGELPLYESSIADSAGREIDLDLPGQALLPMPSHNHSQDVASSPADPSSTVAAEIAAMKPRAGFGTSFHDPLLDGLNDWAGQPATQELPVANHAPSSSLEQTDPTATLPSAAGHGVSDSQRIARAKSPSQAGNAIDGSSTIQATVVSNRTASEERFSVPSLEDLESSNSAADHDGPRYTQTPFGITDWDAYLPSLTAGPSPAAGPDSKLEPQPASGPITR